MAARLGILTGCLCIELSPSPVCVVGLVWHLRGAACRRSRWLRRVVDRLR